MVEEVLVVQYSYSTSDIINMPASSRGKETVVLLPNDTVHLSPAGDQNAISSYQPAWGKGRGGCWGAVNKVLYRKALPRGSTPYPFIYYFLAEKVRLSYTFYWQIVYILVQKCYIAVNCYKCNVFAEPESFLAIIEITPKPPPPLPPPVTLTIHTNMKGNSFHLSLQINQSKQTLALLPWCGRIFLEGQKVYINFRVIFLHVASTSIIALDSSTLKCDRHQTASSQNN